MGMFKYKLAMSAHINFEFLVNRTLLKMGLSIVRSDVGVSTSPGKLIRFPPTLIRLICVSDFCGCISSTIIPYVTVLPAVIFSLGTKKIVFVPDDILVTNSYASRHISFANEFTQMAPVGPLIRCLYYRDAPVVRSTTTLA